MVNIITLYPESISVFYVSTMTVALDVFFLCNTKNIAVIQRNIIHNIWDAPVFSFHIITITQYFFRLF